jgi:hypothetical protein
VVSFCTLVRLPIPKKETVGTLLGVWNTGGINNRARTFIFKFYNNLLGLNTRLSHFVANQNRGCTFCEGTFTTVPDESFIHIFLECTTTFDWHNQFLRKYLPHLTLMDLQSRTALFFFGNFPGDGTGTVNNKHVSGPFDSYFPILYLGRKTKEKKPSFSTIDLQFGEHIRTLTNMNKKFLFQRKN